MRAHFSIGSRGQTRLPLTRTDGRGVFLFPRGLGVWSRAIVYMCLFGTVWFVALPMALVRLGGGVSLVLRSSGWVAFGAALLVAGCTISVTSGYYLVTLGRGTPFPLDPTRELVTTGPYSWIRNPQALGTLLIVIGEVASVRSRTLMLMVPFTIVYLEGLAGPYEDRELRRRYGNRYIEYRKRVAKWVPRPPIVRDGVGSRNGRNHL